MTTKSLSKASKEQAILQSAAHFFAKEVSNEDYNAIERETLTAKEWGVEVCVKSH